MYKIFPKKMCQANVVWFRHGLRIHDNPALLEALSDQKKGITLLPLYIFDPNNTEFAEMGYNRMKFLLESLRDLNDRFEKVGGRLFLFEGSPVMIFRCISNYVRINKIIFEQDCEPVWKDREELIHDFCVEYKVEVIKTSSHTLWDPAEVIKTNGGIPPLTYQMFLHTVNIMGPPSRPLPPPCWRRVKFPLLPTNMGRNIIVIRDVPASPGRFSLHTDSSHAYAQITWRGGEREALELLDRRLAIEAQAFKENRILPNQSQPDIKEEPTSMSAHLRLGCISVRRFYWAIHDTFQEIQSSLGGSIDRITGQLIWREYFYTMSINNPNFGQIQDNVSCLNIPWAEVTGSELDEWKSGQTGFPLVDAAMRQLLAEGWIHHTLRNIVATFLTRGGLWLSWEHGLRHFLNHLLDADWAVCSGNWMWVSSSAFEQLLDSSICTCPIALSRRLDPNGEYIRRYVPELRNVPTEFIHQPWNCPVAIQENIQCVIGVNYPIRIIDFDFASKRNSNAMIMIRQKLIEEDKSVPLHCRPSNDAEIRRFFWLVE